MCENERKWPLFWYRSYFKLKSNVCEGANWHKIGIFLTAQVSYNMPNKTLTSEHIFWAV